MSLKVFHKYSTAAGTPPAAGDIDVGEIAINAADAELYAKDTVGNVKTFSNNETLATKATFIQSGAGAAQRTIAAKLQDVVSVKDFGAVGDGVTDDTAAIDSAFTYCGSTGKKCFVPAGIYTISNTVTWAITNDFGVECEAGAVFKATASLPVDGKLFLPSATSGAQRFAWQGGQIDGRLMPARNTGAPDLLYIANPYIQDVVISGVHFLANDTRSGTAGDSCLFLAEGQNYKVTECTFQGAVDAAIYTSGNQAQTTGNSCIVDGNFFVECNVAYIAKRLFTNQLVSNNLVASCNSGIVVGGEADATLLPGAKAVISGNLLTKCTNVSIEARIANATVITGNRIEDYAVNAAGLPVIGYGIIVSGSSYCSVTGNVLIYTEAYAPALGSSAIYLYNRTYNSVAYPCVFNLVSSNTIRKPYTAILENTGANANIFADNQIRDEVVRFSVSGADTLLQDINVSNKRLYKRFGASGGTPTPGVHELLENSTGHLSQVLLPNTGAWQLLMGDSDSATVARMGYDHTVDRWQWRAGGSGVVFQVDNTGPRWGTRVATSDVPITGYITITDEGGTTRKLAIID